MAENQFSAAFSPAFDSDDVGPGPGPDPIPAGTTVLCYPDGTDWSCAYSTEELEAMRGDADIVKVMERSEALAWYTLASLTAYQIGVCVTTVRPCAVRCEAPGTWTTSTVRGGSYSSLPTLSIGTFTPHINTAGIWVNACGCRSVDDCSCTALCEVVLPGPVGGIESVTLDGIQLAATDYRVDNGNRLVRTDGECWPSCQDFATSAGDVGLWVRYYRGAAPNPLTQYAAGVLATEFYKACSGKGCRLPSGVTSVTRLGVSYSVIGGSFPGGITGIHEVDAVIRIFNPYGLISPPRVISPDRRPARQTSWVHL